MNTMQIKLTPLGRHEAYLHLYNILTSLPIAKDETDEYIRLERQLAASLIKVWTKNFTNTLKELFKSIPKNTSDEVFKIITEGLDKHLGHEFGRANEIRKLFHKYIGDTYEKSKSEFIAKHSLSLPDKRAIEILTKHNCFWLGEHYGKHIGPKIAEITQQAIDEGLGRKELAEELRNALGGEVGGYKYWDVASSAALVRARSFGAISGMEEAGIAEYEILAMQDERMCPICGEMHGRVFSVAESRKVIDRVLEIEDPNKFKEAMPWQTESPKGVSNADLQSAGMSLPPFHGRCRCTVVMVSEYTNEHHEFISGFTKIQGEHSNDEDLATVNPNYSTGLFEWRNNCQRCVIAYEARRRGYDVEALPIIGDPKSDSLSYANKDTGWPSVFKDAQIISCVSDSGENNGKKVCEYMKKFGDGARAIVRIGWEDENGGHVFIAEQKNGKTIFLDPQRNRKNVEKYFKKAKKQGTLLCRIDDKEFTAKIKQCCKNRENKSK